MSQTPNQLRTEIEDLVADLLEANLAIATRATLIQKAGTNSFVSWASGVPVSVFEEEFGSIAEYLAYLNNAQYTCVLYDGALIQLSYVYARDEIVKHRLGYYPCPLRVERNDYSAELDFGEAVGLLFDSETLAVLDESHLVGATRLRLRSPVRFDFDSEGATLDHAASHVHLLSSECRWPVFGPVSVGHFVRFVFRRFYTDAWREHSFLREWPLRFRKRTIAVDECQELFIECNQPSAASTLNDRSSGDRR
jgi:hypothetical protein